MGMAKAHSEPSAVQDKVRRTAGACRTSSPARNLSSRSSGESDSKGTGQRGIEPDVHLHHLVCSAAAVHMCTNSPLSEPSVVEHTPHFRAWEAEAGGSVVPGQLRLCSKFETSLGNLKPRHQTRPPSIVFYVCVYWGMLTLNMVVKHCNY